jgi:CheY-like chemotaxis protein
LPITGEFDKEIRKEKISKKKKIKTILIAEDEYSNYEYLLSLLEDFNLNIIYAENGQKAIDLCRGKSEVDFILMDIKMPVMDGFTAAKLIKGFRADITIIAQTALALEVEKDQFTGVFDDYITKPINIDEFEQLIKKHIEIY